MVVNGCYQKHRDSLSYTCEYVALYEQSPDILDVGALHFIFVDCRLLLRLRLVQHVGYFDTKLNPVVFVVDTLGYSFKRTGELAL